MKRKTDLNPAAMSMKQINEFNRRFKERFAECEPKGKRMQFGKDTHRNEFNFNKEK